MSETAFHIIALVIYFIGMLAIGYYAYRKTTDHEDYMLGGRDLPPWAAALSAGASDMSGWLMLGLPGAIYVSGLIEAWIAIGLTIGAFLNWKLVAPRLRAYTEVSRNSITIPSFFENRMRDNSHLLRVLSGVIILVFFTLYISAGMVAGGVFFEATFGSSYLFGMILVTVVTLSYTLFGGFLGASLTDVAQGVLMMLALIVVPIIAVVSLGGPIETLNIVEEIDPAHLSLFGDGLTVATVLTIVSALAWGLGYFGQPHIIVRFMALRNSAAAKSARRIGMSWMIVSLTGAVSAGLIGLAYFTANDIPLDNPETVMLVMSKILLHPLVAGFVLAAVLAAIMSSLSSQLIVTSSALVEDLYRLFRKNPALKTLVMLGRVCVFGIAIIAAALAITPNDTILALIGFAWAGFGASFGPVILLSLFWKRLTTGGALAAMAVGAITVFVWDAVNKEIYELLPAFTAATVAAIIVSKFTYQPDPEIEQEFAESVALTAAKAP